MRKKLPYPLAGQFWGPKLLAEHFAPQFFRMFVGPCMLTMACYPIDPTCAYYISMFLPNIQTHVHTYTDIFDKNYDHTFH